MYGLSRVPFRTLLWTVVGIYLLADLGLGGPVAQKFQRWLPWVEDPHFQGEKRNWAALVNGSPITRAQLDLALDVALLRRGVKRGDLSPKNLGLLQMAVLDGMISDELVRLWSQAQPVEVPEEWLQGRVDQFERKFAPGELKAYCQAQGLSRASLHRLLREHARQQYWIEKRTSESYEVFSWEKEEWYRIHQNRVEVPEMRQVRHLFFSRIFGDGAEKQILLRKLVREIESEAISFDEAARKFSEDERSKARGGDLGYLMPGRVPEDFWQAVSQLEVGARDTVETSLGWHFVEVLDVLPPRELAFKELEPEIAIYLENSWREAAVEELLHDQLRTPRRAKVEIFRPGIALPEDGGK